MVAHGAILRCNQNSVIAKGAELADEFIQSTGDIPGDYVVLDIVYGHSVVGSQSKGCSSELDKISAVRNASARMAEAAQAMGGDGVIFMNFTTANASVASGCAQGPRAGYEVIGWGTAIRRG